jgi:hypothetical protein
MVRDSTLHAGHPVHLAGGHEAEEVSGARKSASIHCMPYFPYIPSLSSSFVHVYNLGIERKRNIDQPFHALLPLLSFLLRVLRARQPLYDRYPL